MPANLTPEFQKAQEWFRNASTDAEKILALEEMLRTIPKHKGTEHMQADIKRRLSKLRAAAESGKKKGGKHVDVFHVPRSGAGQVALIGVPNSGKSSIVGALSNAKVNIADYPFATSVPVPGMIQFEDVPIQLVDAPPVTADYAAPGQVGTYRGADLIGIVIDLSADVSEQWKIILDYLESHRLLLDESTSEPDANGNTLGRKAFVICTKSDSAPDGAFEKLKRICDRNFEFVMISTVTGEGLNEFAAKVFELLDIIRVYAKKPGKEPDMKEPFTMPRGSTVKDLSREIHRELAEKLKSARCWGEDVHNGQNVHRTYELKDKDIIELHFQ